eukprot:SAG25_NODE_3322_length_1129_cov_3.297087_2_plen_57_part_01
MHGCSIVQIDNAHRRRLRHHRSHSQLSAAACCLLLLVCLSASIPPYSPTVADAYRLR